MKLLFVDDLKSLELETTVERAVKKLKRDLGDVFLDALRDPNVIEIMLNPNKTIWIEKHGKMSQVGEMNANQSESLLKMVASCVKEELDPCNPLIECELPFHGARFEGMLPPIVANPTITIRKHAEDIYTLEDYVNSGILTQYQNDVLISAVKNRKNILVAGSTSSGKTTFTNAVLDAIETVTPEHRLIVIEDTNEIQLKGGNNVVIRSNTNFTMLQALRATMRLNPTRIVVGEVRGGEALTLLKSWNTGHPGGLCTVHANGAEAALIRMEQLIGESSATPMQSTIAEAIDLIVFIERDETSKVGRKISSIVHLKGYSNGEYLFENI